MGILDYLLKKNKPTSSASVPKFRLRHSVAVASCLSEKTKKNGSLSSRFPIVRR